MQLLFIRHINNNNIYILVSDNNNIKHVSEHDIKYLFNIEPLSEIIFFQFLGNNNYYLTSSFALQVEGRVVLELVAVVAEVGVV